jgi:hypothetical protein
MEQGTVRAEDFDELESHLLDDMEQLGGSGLSPAEAFLVASHRIGTAPELAAEYGKVNGGLAWASRIFWMLTGFAAVSLILSLAGVLSRWLGAGMMLSGLVEAPLLRLAIQYVALAALFVPVLVLATVPDGRQLLVSLADGVAGWARRHPAAIIVLCFLLYLGLRALGIARNIVLSRLVEVEAFGQEAFYSMYFHLGWSILFPFMMLALMIWTYRCARGARV